MYYDKLTDVERKLLEEKGVTPEHYENDCESGLIYQNFVESITQKDGSVVYPDYYGGAYVDENGKLVIYVLNQDERTLSDLKCRMGGDCYSVRIAKYSYRSLLEQMNEIIEYKKNDAGNAIKVFVLNDKENRLDIFLENMDDAVISALRKKVKSGADISFFMGSGMTFIPQANATCGQKVHTKVGGIDPYGSLAFRARRNGVDGMLSAHHNFSYNAQKPFIAYDSNSVAVGTSIASINNINADVCFLQASSGYTPSNNFIDGTGPLAITLHTPAVGQLIFLYGATSGSTVGYLTNTAVCFVDDFGVTKVLYGTDYSSQKGDSGGIIYRNISGTRYACGIHCGATRDMYEQNSPLYGVFTLASNACNQLGATRY